MRRALPVLLLSLLVPAAPAGAASTTDLIALQRGKVRRIVALDPVSLRPVSRGIPVAGNYAGGLAVSPDRRRFAVATNVPRGCVITVVRRASFTRQRAFFVPGVEVLGGDQIHWLTADRLAVQTNADYGSERVRFHDPSTGRENADRVRIPYESGGPLDDDGRLYVLRANLPIDEDLQPNLSVIEPSGKLFASTPLPTVGTEDFDVIGRSFALDPRTGHPVVLGPTNGHVDVVDPETGGFTDHAIRVPSGTTSTFAGAGAGSRLAVDHGFSRRGTRRLSTLDTRRWRTSKPWTVRGNTEAVSFGDLVLVASGFTSGSSLRGVRATTLTGRARWTGVAGHRVRAATAIGPRVYADTQGVGLSVLSAGTGKTLATRRTTKPDGLQLLGSAADGLRSLESPAR